MALLNSYIHEGKYSLTDEAKDFNPKDKIHPTRLLNPAVFRLSESPIYEDGVINVGSLAMASKALPFLRSFESHIGDMTEYLLTSIMNGDGWLRKDYKLSNASKQVISGIDKCRDNLSENFAVVTEYIIRHFPEDGKIVESDWSRNNAYNWLGVIKENKKNPLDYGFDSYDEDGEDVVFIPDPEHFTPEGIDISEKQFIARVKAIIDTAPKINFAIESACSILNLLNYKFFKHELMEFEPDPDQQDGYFDTLKEPQSSDDIFAYCTRWFEATFRKRKYNYQNKLGRSEDGYIDYSTTNTPYFNFLKHECKVYSKEFKLALRNLKKHGVSLRYKGKQLEDLKSMADLYPQYLEARKTVFGWYSNRFGSVEDDEMERAMELVLQNYERVTNFIDHRSKLNATLFIADQRVIADAKNKGEELPAVSEIKTEMDAVEKLGPHLDKLGLKIVPKDVKIDSKDQPQTTTVTDVTPFIKASRNILAHGKYIEADLSKVPEWMRPDPKPASPSMVSAENLKQPKISKDTESFDEGFEYDQKLKKWKDTETFKSFFDKLGGSGECSLVDIGLVKSNKTLLSEKEEIDRIKQKEDGKTVKRGNKMTTRSAYNSGSKFVKEAQLLPCRNFRTLSRSDSVMKVFEAAYRVRKKISGKSTEANDAKAELSKDKDFLVAPDKVLNKHLKKLKCTKKQIEEYTKQVDKFEGTVEGTSNVKYNTEEVAIAFCEGQKKPSDSGQ
jgi:hypothetical protein